MKIKLRKGLDIKLLGAAQGKSAHKVESHDYAVAPEDYPGLSAKVDVKEGDRVRIGSKILHDKTYTEICLTSPVSGVVKSIVRGERRRILRVEIESDGKMTRLWDDLEHSPVGTVPTLGMLCRSGLFAQIRRRPYDVVPDPAVRPRDIFVTAFDSSPLATSLAARLGDDARGMLDMAVETLTPLTDGKIYICVDKAWPFGAVKGAEMVVVEGPHPAGNVGIQIANIAPINKGDDVWAMDVVTLYKIGKLFATGKLDTSTIVALTGPEVSNPCLIRTHQGAKVAALLKGHGPEGDHHLRVISGNVLTGTVVSASDGFLRFPWQQITVIAEGDDVDEFMGWASLSSSKLSVSPTFPLRRRRKFFMPDARLCGGRRAMILSGEYDKVMPADILVEYLVKAILSKNIEDMEALGIYEVAPADVALCEFVDASKMPLQRIVRDGLDWLRKEIE